jgi:hypothetical protein
VGPCGNTLQDGIAIFPRLAQTMLGVNTCDNHIYANGYVNIPGQTEPASCNGGVKPVDANGNSTDPNLSGEVFGGFDPSTGRASNRHMWRVMGMIDLAKGGCGFLSPSTTPQTDPSCYPGNNGLQQYGGTPTSATQPNSGTAGGGGGCFFPDVWGGIWGGGGA